MNKYANEIRAILLNVADDKIKEKVLRLTSGAKCIGVTVPRIRSLSKTFKQKYSNLTIEELCAIMDTLCKNKCREEILFGIFLIANFKKNILAIPWTKINSWLDALDNWETCDQLSSNIVTPIIAKNISLIDKLKPLAQSNNLWKRRFAVATAANINHGGRQFPDQTLAICKILLTDKEIMVTKAVGWALREISKKSPDLVFNFLKTNNQYISERLMKESSEILSKN
jgi:3-methyladenine DNA glycosylase AlkD